MSSAGESLLSPEAAQELVLSHVRRLGAERVGLDACAGRVLARPVTAAGDIPPADNSAMDGYAVRFADVAAASPEQPAAVTMIDDIPAGAVGRAAVGPGQASRIMTGAPLPAGADTVIRVEYTRAEAPGIGARILILNPERAGANIRRRGEDMAAGQPVLPAGTCCGPAEIGTLAALRRSIVTVYRRPRLAILSTGDELAEVEDEPGAGRIVNANAHALAALARAAGAEPLVVPLARDREAELRDAIAGALDADLLVSSGGVSVGAYDLVKKVLADLGATTVLWGVAMTPGKPLFFAVLAGKPYFGLPGNPVSSMISFLQFVRPAVRKASGWPAAAWRLAETTAVLATAARNRGERRLYLRARLCCAGGRLQADPLPAQGSHMLTSMLGANGLVLLEPGQSAAAGEAVRVQSIGPLL